MSAICMLHNVRLHISDKASRHFDPETEAGGNADTVASDTDPKLDNGSHYPHLYDVHSVDEQNDSIDSLNCINFSFS